MAAYKNWSGAYTFGAAGAVQPTSLDELRRLVASAETVHAVGSRHSYNGIADSATMIVLDRMPLELAIDRETMTVAVNGAMRYAELGLALERAGLALHNMASVPHITVAGAIATATHGSGNRLQNLAGAVAGIEFVTSDGDVLRVTRGDAEFEGMVVHLGALGVVHRVTLAVEPSYQMRQEVFLELGWETLFEQFDEIFASGDSVSIFTDYGETVNELWVKRRVVDDEPWSARAEFFGGRPATSQVHPVAHLDGTYCTGQLGAPGPWCERMPHFQVEALGDAGNEMQAEYIVPREHAVAAIRALRELFELTQPYIMTAEIRTVAADELWLSSSYQRDSVCLHYTFVLDPAIPAQVLPAIEEALAPYAPRPHWGKLFTASAAELAPRYPRMEDFRALVTRLDPRGAFRNEFLLEKVFGV